MAIALHGSEEALQLKEKFMAEVSGAVWAVGGRRLVVLGGGGSAVRVVRNPGARSNAAWPGSPRGPRGGVFTGRPLGSDRDAKSAPVVLM